MQELKTLIDKASLVCGSDTQLALRIGVYQPDIAAMRAGTRKISPMSAAELADIAGESVEDAVMVAVIESARGTRREHEIVRILGKGFRSGLETMIDLSKKGYQKKVSGQQTFKN